MAEEPARRERRLAEAAGFVAFVLVLVLADWLVYGASLVLFRLEPGSVPENFFVAYRAQKPGPQGPYYAAITWNRYPAARAELGIETFILADAAGPIASKGNSLSFRVLENDGPRQVVEVKYDGAYTSWSRYEAYRDRVVPIGYRSYGWGYEPSTHLPALLISLALGGLAAWGAAAGAVRLARLRRA